MDRRPLIALFAAGALAVSPAGARGASPGTLIAQSGTAGLSQRAATDGDLFAQADDTGGLSRQSTSEPDGTARGSSTRPRSATASALPYTGSDPRILLALGLAAILTGAGLRLRTGDARDF